MTKPFAIEELLARIRVAIKRKGAEPAAAAEVLRYQELKVDHIKHQVQYKEDIIELTKKNMNFYDICWKQEHSIRP